MPLKNDWANGDLFTPAAANDMANVVNAFGFDRVVSTRVVTGTGIDLTGATNSNTAFQAILDAAAADAAAGSGTVEVYIPPGILSLTTMPTIGAGVTLRGAGMGATTIRSSNTSGVLSLTGASDITISDLTVESTATGTSSIGIASNYNGLQSRFTITNCRITGTTNTAVRFPYAIHDLTFTDNLIKDCVAGFTLYAPTTASGLISTGIVVSRNRFRNVGAVNIQLYGGTNALTVSTVVGAEISGNDLRDFAQTGAAGPIPIEPTQVTNLRISNNMIVGPSTRGISMACNINTTVTGNTITDQSFYAFELNGGRQISIVGNNAENCKALVQQTNDNTAVPLADVVIANNTYFGSGQSSAQSVEAIRLRACKRVRVSGNVLTDWQYLRTAIRVGDGADQVAEDCVVEGNTLVITNANTPLQTIQVRSAIRTNVVRNTVRVNRNLASGDDYTSVITAQQTAESADILIDGNHIMFTGTVAAATSAAGIGHGNAAAAALAGLTVCRNAIFDGPYGLRLTTTSTDLAVFDNDTFTCTTNAIPATARINRVLDEMTTLSNTQSLTNKNLTSGTNTFPTLNQNTTGTAAGLSSTLAVASGGTGQTSAAAAITALTGTQTSGRYLRSDGTNAALAAIQAADVPTLNQNTTGTAANVTGTVALANGGTGQTTAAAAITALTGSQISGRYLRSDGTNAELAAIQAADVPTLNQNTTGTAGNGIPTGGAANQTLSKVDGTNYNTQWTDTLAGSSLSATSWPGGASGEYIVFGGQTATTAQAEGRLIFTPYWAPKAFSISRIAINVTTAGSAGSVIRIGAYNDDNGIPGTLIFDAGTVDSTTTGIKEITTTQTLPAGRFWLAAVVQGAASPTLAAMSATNANSAWNSNATLSPTAQGLDAVYFSMLRASVSGALPDPAYASRASAGVHNVGYVFRIRLS